MSFNANCISTEISRARKLVNLSIDRLIFIKNRFNNGNKNNESVINRTNKLLDEYHELDKEVKRYEYN